ncbi:hypothetical protein ICW40_08205 [Actinotalea ferrariae]|uniref:hypothetical protein n=1 Tax=Actinotalea ferrariae TaxID=1386098 RepID=UPI001C8B9B3F|nr:hypothetical protein [Actinotalea ferrariae]MBX9244791.1 hypothetical protein [Actinotalea ferrariae]
MRLSTPVAALAGAAALCLAVAGAASAAPFAGPVSLVGSLDLPDQRSGPKVFAVDGIVVGAGPELTGADEVENPSGWCGDLLVDIDPDAQTITVSADQAVCDFYTVDLDVLTTEIATVTVVSDALGDDRDPATTTDTVLDAVVDGTGVHLSWTRAAGVGAFYTAGSTVLSYTLVPAPVVTPPVVTPVVTAPVVAAPVVAAPVAPAAPARVVVAAPTFAG